MKRVHDLFSVVVGIGCLVTAALLPVTAPVLIPAGTGLVGLACKRPSETLGKKRK